MNFQLYKWFALIIDSSMYLINITEVQTGDKFSNMRITGTLRLVLEERVTFIMSLVYTKLSLLNCLSQLLQLNVFFFYSSAVCTF